MQAIERYGVVALLLLIGTVVAVLVWDGTPIDQTNTVAAAELPATSQSTASARAEPRADSPADSRDPGQVSLSGRAESRALRRGGLQQVSPGSSAGLDPAAQDPNGSRETPLWNPPAQAYQPVVNDQPRVETTDFYPEQQPEYYVPEPIPTTTYEPRPVLTALPAVQGRRYRIKGGDTLGQISLDQLGTSKRWREIVELNPGLNENKLYVGKEILLPGTDDAPAEIQPQSKPAPSTPSGAVYVVKSGDNLWKIAARLLGDRDRWREIRDLNPNIDPDKIRVGQKLTLPASARTVSEPIVASSTKTGTGDRRSVR
jgi:nucleoid-associated protein YgaU